MCQALLGQEDPTRPQAGWQERRGSAPVWNSRQRREHSPKRGMSFLAPSSHKQVALGTNTGQLCSGNCGISLVPGTLPRPASRGQWQGRAGVLPGNRSRKETGGWDPRDGG